MPTISDYVYQQAGGQVQPLPNVWVQLVNNATGTAYVSTAVTTPQGLFTVFAPPGTYTMSTGVTSGGPWTPTGDANYPIGEQILGWVSVRDYGAKGDGVTNDQLAFANALAALPSGGGTLYIPPSASPYVLSSPLSLGLSRVRLKGGGPAAAPGSTSQLKFTGISGPLLAGNNSTDLELEDLAVQWNPSFAGTVLDLSGSGFARVFNCQFQSTGGAGSSAALIIGMDNSTDILVDRCIFHNALIAVQGVSTSGHVSIGCTVRDCQFSSSTGDIATAHINNPGSGWVIENNIFQMGTGAGTPQAIAQSVTGSTAGVAVQGNWFGNGGAGALTYINATGNGWAIVGNVMVGNGNAGTTLISCGVNTIAVMITGVEFLSAGTGVAFIAGNVQQAHVLGCSFSGVTNPYSAQLPASGLLYTPTATNFGAIRILSSLQRSSQAPAFAASYTPDPTLGESVEMTLTANITVNAPANGLAGQRLVFKWLQDGTGGRTITYNAAFHTGGGAAIVTTLSTMTIDEFECSRDGVTWRLISRVTGQA